MPGLLGNPHLRSHFPDLLERGVARVFFNELDLWDSGIVEQIFNMDTSVKAAETEVIVAGLGLATPIAEGGNPDEDNMQEAWKVTYTHQAWAVSSEFSHESIADNLYLTLGKEMASELARTMAYTRQITAFDFLNDSTKNIYTYGASSFPLLSTSHPLVSGGTWANKRAAKVLLSQEALEDAIQQWTTQMVDLRGRKQVVKPAFLIHGAGDEMLVDRLLNTPNRAQSADNDLNPLRKTKITPICVPHLTDDGRWFLLGPKRAHRLRFWDREKPLMKRVDSNVNWNVRLMSYMRNSHGAASADASYGSWT